MKAKLSKLLPLSLICLMALSGCGQTEEEIFREGLDAMREARNSLKENDRLRLNCGSGLSFTSNVKSLAYDEITGGYDSSYFGLSLTSGALTAKVYGATSSDPSSLVGSLTLNGTFKVNSSETSLPSFSGQMIASYLSEQTGYLDLSGAGSIYNIIKSLAEDFPEKGYFDLSSTITSESLPLCNELNAYFNDLIRDMENAHDEDISRVVVTKEGSDYRIDYTMSAEDIFPTNGNGVRPSTASVYVQEACEISSSLVSYYIEDGELTRIDYDLNYIVDDDALSASLLAAGFSESVSYSEQKIQGSFNVTTGSSVVIDLPSDLDQYLPIELSTDTLPDGGLSD